MSVQVGIIGAGYISGVHQRNLSLDPRVEIVGLYDIEAARAGPRAFASVDELLAASDAVYVASPNRTHVDYSLRALEAGRHVFCEKPMAVDLDDARRVHEAAKKSDRVFQVGHNRRFSKVYKRLKELLAEHPPHCAHVKMNRGELLKPAWTGDEAVTGGFLFETPIHMFDMLRFQFGEIVELHARESRKDDFSLLVEFASGAHATFTTTADASWFFPFESVEAYGAYSTIRTAEMEWLEYRLGLDQPTCSEHFAALDLETKWGFAEEDRLFIDAVESGGPPPVGSLDGLRSVEAAVATYRAARERRPVRLEHDE